MKSKVAYISLAILLFLSGCAPKDVALSDGNILTRSELQVKSGLFGPAGDLTYAIVKSQSLPSLYENYKTVLNRQGIIKWDEKFDCNHFASLYVSVAQIKFLALNWHSNVKAGNLALGEIWYRPGEGKTGHAIVAAYTERGLLFIEPQDGKILQLTEAEIKTIYFVKW